MYDKELMAEVRGMTGLTEEEIGKALHLRAGPSLTTTDAAASAQAWEAWVACVLARGALPEEWPEAYQRWLDAYRLQKPGREPLATRHALIGGQIPPVWVSKIERGTWPEAQQGDIYPHGWLDPDPEPFRNQHLSYSRLSRFEQCPLSFKLHYIEKLKSEPTLPLRFGKAVHSALEWIVRDHVKDLDDCWKKACRAEQMTDLPAFIEGQDIIKRYLQRSGDFDPKSVLAIEKEFWLKAGPFKLMGFIDRVDRTDDETIEIIDYKTNRVLFTREEVDSSLQMSIYQIAAKKLWPWAKNVKLVYEMLRHDCRMVTTRTEEDLESALAYAEVVGHMTETVEYKPKLNSNCIYCDHKAQCPAYADALAGKRSVICEDLADLEAVAAEREEVAILAKILYDRKKELEDIIKAHLEEAGEIGLGGMKYSLKTYQTRQYQPAETLRIIRERMPDVEIDSLVDVSAKAVDAAVSRLRKVDKISAAQLKMELESAVDLKPSQRLNASKA